MHGSITQQFDVFAQIVASGNIKATAEELNLPVASVIAAMNALEDKLGLQLFMVADGAVELTSAGQKAVFAMAELSIESQEKWVNSLVGQPARDTQSNAESENVEKQELRSALNLEGEDDFEPPPRERRKTNADEAVDEDSITQPKHFRPHDPKKDRSPAEPVQSITLASDPSIFSHFQEELVAFEDASPDIGITLRLTGLDIDQLTTLFADKTADIGYFFTLDEKDAFNSRYAWSERISLFTGRDNKLAKLDNAVADDLRTIPYVALAPDNIARNLAEESLARHGLQVSKPVLETDNLYDIMKYIMKHESYFVAFGAMARDFGKMSGISRLAYTQGLPQVHVRQAVRPDLAKDPAVLALAEFLFR